MKFTFWTCAVCGILVFVFAVANIVARIFFQDEILEFVFSSATTLFFVLGVIFFSILLIGLDTIKKIEEKFPEKTEEATIENQ